MEDRVEGAVEEEDGMVVVDDMEGGEVRAAGQEEQVLLNF